MGNSRGSGSPDRDLHWDHILAGAKRKFATRIAIASPRVPGFSVLSDDIATIQHGIAGDDIQRFYRLLSKTI